MLSVVCKVFSDCLFGPSMIQIVVVRSPGFNWHSVSCRGTDSSRAGCLPKCLLAYWPYVFGPLFLRCWRPTISPLRRPVPNRSGVYGSVCFDSFLHQMFFLCQVNQFFATKTLLPNQKPRAHFKPEFTNFCNIPSYSPAAGANETSQDPFLNLASMPGRLRSRVSQQKRAPWF